MKNYQDQSIKTPSHRFDALDGIRGIAAVLVAFFWHYQHFNPTSYSFSTIGYWPYHFGWIMVDLFFVLSGFIFFNIYRNKIANKSLNIKDFFLLRFSRLYPLHLLMLVIVASFQFYRKWHGMNFFVYPDNSFSSFIQNVLLFQSGWIRASDSFNGPAWSISVEILMYLIFFIMFYYSNNAKKYLFYCSLLICIGLGITAFHLSFPFLNDQVARGLIGFFVGCISGEVYHYCINNRKVEKYLLFLCAMGILLMVFVPEKRIWTLVHTIVCFPSLIIITLKIKYVTKLLSLKPFVYLGALSYSIYLVHYPIQLIIKTIDDYYHLQIDYSKNIFFCGFVVLVLLAAHILHFYYERPLQSFIRNKFRLN